MSGDGSQCTFEDIEKLIREMHILPSAVSVDDGDVLVFYLPCHASEKMIDNLRRQMKAVFPTQKIVLLDVGMRFDVVKGVTVNVSQGGGG